ncbi:MAG: alpha-ketoglutarate-dependent dioxygenase AlkB [endosymbiont of Galathealinum brachiosum]|uniref:Alpha-ketoglutarate-dependent dioxygenase AlkB n=1 Tax=endosymbiont of Galathealinum brachiosum TaxID=2200906 RepID=A0A370D959_9GAMM|nr:MAG: alpha-ketoglutarate-dependent dioxygenase AlkB [endosymbiont of Galathealinum brachiosum]
MNLFNYDPALNLLPCDGEVNCFGNIFSVRESELYLQGLLNNIEWKNDEVIIYGKHITTKRKVAWYGDNNFAYRYSNITRHALCWTKELLTLKAIVESHTNVTYNSCLLNLYHNGDEAMSWHCDDESTLGKNPNIASLSFGAERKFSLKHKTSKQTVSLLLEPGTLLVMKGTTQNNWLHCLPKMKNIPSPRINLTFRTFG